MNNATYIVGAGVFIGIIGTAAAIAGNRSPVRPVVGGVAVVALLGLIQAAGMGDIAKGLAILSVVSVAAYNGGDLIQLVGG